MSYRILNPQQTLFGQNVRYSNLHMCLRSWASWQQARYDNIAEFMVSEPSDSYAGTVGTYSTIPGGSLMTVYVDEFMDDVYDGKMRACAITKDAYEQALDNLGGFVPVLVARDDGTTVEMQASAHTVIENLAQEARSALANSTIAEYCADHSLNDLVDLTQLQTLAKLKGLNDLRIQDSNVLQAIGSTSKVSDMLAVFTTLTTQPKSSEDGLLYTMDSDDFHGGNCFITAVNNVVDTVSAFFADIKVKFGELSSLMKQVGRAIGNVLKWVLDLVNPGLGVDYEYQGKALDRGCDMPVFSFSGSTASCTALMKSAFQGATTPQKRDLLRFGVPTIFTEGEGPGSWAHSVEWVLGYSSENAFSAGVDVSEIASWLELLIPGHCVVMPCQRGYVVLQRSSIGGVDTIQIFFYAGAHCAIAQKTDNMVLRDDENQLISLSCDWKAATTMIPQLSNNAGNLQFASSIKSMLDGPMIGEELGLGYGAFSAELYQALNVPIGNSQYGSDGSHSKAADLIQYLSPLWNLTISNHPGFSDLGIASLLFWVAGVAMLTQSPEKGYAISGIRFTSAQEGGVTSIETVTPAAAGVSETDFTGQYLPYEEDYFLSFDVHVQSDSERAGEVLKTVLAIVAAAAAAASAVAFVKVKKKRKLKLSRRKAEEYAALDALKEDPSNKDLQKLHAKAQKRLDKAERLNEAIGSTDPVSKMGNELTKLSGDASPDENATTNFSSVEKLITG